MATLGAALGFSASAAAADHASNNTVTADGVRDVAVGFSIGAGVWLLISAVVVGIAGGIALAKMSHQDRPYAPGTLGLATWSLGVCIAVFLAASGASGLATGLGIGAAGAAAAAPTAMRSSEVGVAGSLEARGVEARDATSRDGVRGAEAALGVNAPPLTPEQRQAAIVAAKAAATAAATAAWFALVAQLLGLGATLWGAGRRKFQADLVTAVHHA